MFFKRKPKVQLRVCHEDKFQFWSVWTRVGGILPYWKYIKGSSDEKAMRALYEAHCKSAADGDRIIVEQF